MSLRSQEDSMAETSIEWATYTFSPWEGCEKVSPGCKNCYAEARDQWLHRGQHWGPQAARLPHKEAYWDQLHKWNKAAEKADMYSTVFCGSLCDILERGSYLDPMRKRLFDIVPTTPRLIYLFLTKRPENWDLFPEEWLRLWPQNAMFGFTAENDEYLIKRSAFWMDLFFRTGGTVRSFISYEPALGPLPSLGYLLDIGGIHWVIAGGESGDNARMPHPQWFRAAQMTCHYYKTPFLFKQWGAWYPTIDLMECVEGMRKADKHQDSGRLLDGRTYDELPSYWSPNVGLPPKAQRKAAGGLVVLP
jgi:protein gp37